MASEEKWLYFYKLVHLYEPSAHILKASAGMSREALVFFLTQRDFPCDIQVEFLPTISGLYKLGKAYAEDLRVGNAEFYTTPNRILTRLDDDESYNTHDIPIKDLESRDDVVQYFLNRELPRKCEAIEITTTNQIVTAAERRLLTPDDFFMLGSEFGSGDKKDMWEKILRSLSILDLEEHAEQFENGIKLGVVQSLNEEIEKS